MNKPNSPILKVGFNNFTTLKQNPNTEKYYLNKIIKIGGLLFLILYIPTLKQDL